jgi:hypothetical protein
MRVLFRLLILLCIGVGLIVLTTGWLALEATPSVVQRSPLTHADIARAQRIIRANDPRHQLADRPMRFVLSASDLDLVVGYLAQRVLGAASRTELGPRQARLELSRELPWPWTRFLNLRLVVGTEQARAVIDEMAVGRIEIPGRLIAPVAGWLLPALPQHPELQRALDNVDRVVIERDRVELAYRYDPGLIDDARKVFTTEADRAALRYYHDRVVALQGDLVNPKGPLPTLLEPLFFDAQLRSADGDPVRENIALLTVLGAWAGHRGLERLVPGEIERPTRFRMTLNGRRDLAKHFLVSAALAARGDSALSNAVGLFKEILDTDRGSGFSFTDFAADIAGSRFGELAVSSDTAAGIQASLAGGVADTVLMPVVDDLPEYLDTQAFEQQFGHIGSPAYSRMMDRIRTRIAAMPLYRDTP